jgi:arsenate reductase
MAEGFAKALKSEKYNFYSAGTKKHGLNQRAVKVMNEIGIDISNHQSNTTDELDVKMDVVFTVCSDAHETCPVFPEGKVIHVGFEDPPRLTMDMTDEDEILKVYRSVRDEIKLMITDIETYIKDK